MRRIRLIALFASLATLLGSTLPSHALAATAARLEAAPGSVSVSTLADCGPANDLASDPRPAIRAGIAQSPGSGHRAALARLIAAAQAFGRAVAANETDQGASDACQAHAAEAAERRIFLRTLEHLAAGDGSDAPLLTIQEADGALNGAYRDVMAVAEPRDLAWGSVDKAGIRRTERAWLAYRDAFVAFAATLGQPDAAERVKIELTARRATSLEAFLAD